MMTTTTPPGRRFALRAVAGLLVGCLWLGGLADITSAEEATATETDVVTSAEVREALADVPGVMASSDTTRVSSDGDSAIVSANPDNVVDIPREAEGAITLSTADGQSLIQHVDFNSTTPTPITMDPWWNTLGNYARCVLGIGVPAGFAWYAIATLGVKAALSAAMNSGRGLPPGFAGTAGRQYARWVWDGCSRFLRS